jgi:hypothetical protein
MGEYLSGQEQRGARQGDDLKTCFVEERVEIFNSAVADGKFRVDDVVDQ